jgi:hypothetical protein
LQILAGFGTIPAMLKDPLRAVQTIQNWIKDYVAPTGRNTLQMLETAEHGVPNLAWAVTKAICENAAYSLVLSSVSDIAQEASSNYSIIVSPIERTYGYLTREYKKHRSGPRDIFPLYELYMSEIRQIARVLEVSVDVPSAEEMLAEWAIRENDKNGIIEDGASPVVTKNWYRYTIEQKQAISHAHQREKKTRHKIIKEPFCPLRSDLVNRKLLFDK